MKNAWIVGDKDFIEHTTIECPFTKKVIQWFKVAQ